MLLGIYFKFQISQAPFTAVIIDRANDAVILIRKFLNLLNIAPEAMEDHNDGKEVRKIWVKTIVQNIEILTQYNRQGIAVKVFDIVLTL